MEENKSRSSEEEVENTQRIEWLNLPTELWSAIAKYVDDTENTTFDIRRFRSVCKTWRSAHPSPPRHHTLFAPLVRIHIPDNESCLLEIKLYRLESLLSPSKGWIIMIGAMRPLCLLNPFTRSGDTSPRVLNLINFRAVELTQAFTLRAEDHPQLCKGVLLSSPRMVCGLDDFDRTFRVHRFEDHMWLHVGDYSDYYQDIILHKGRVFIIDDAGTIFWMNPLTLELVEFSQSLPQGLATYRWKKQMVESQGSLYLVDNNIQESNDREQVVVEVYKLDEERRRWVNVKNLGDDAFVLGQDFNFSLSAQDYYGCQGNCIYFSHEDEIFCYGLKDSKLMISPSPFWPCPNLFSPEFNSDERLFK